jgi:thiol:disulfide interchange protein
MGLEYRNLFDSSGNGGPSVLFERTSVDNAKFFDAAGMRLPVPNKGWDVSGTYVTDNGKQALDVSFTNKFGHDEKDLGELQFFPEQGNVLDPQASPVMLPQKNANSFSIRIPLIQNGEKVDKISGVLTSTVPLVSEKTGDNHAVYIAEFPVTAADGIVVDKEVSQAVDTNAGKASVAGDSDGYRGGAPGDAGATAPPMETSAATSEIQPLLIVVLASAFIGGLILNLMPCVLPVLSLKVFSLIKHAGDHPKQVWQQGAAFTAGVVLSFWVLAGILLAFKAASHQLGWGFQMQSPGFVLFLVYLFFLLGLNLLGVFELGASLVGIDAKASGQAGGLFSSFLNGALATLAATPCTAPFMGSALGFAAQQSNFVSMLVFTFVALGMAAPYMLLTMFPAALKFVPKPGAWMEAFKQFMGFLLLATVVWLADVFTALVGPEAMFFLLYVLLLLACAAWAYGRWQKGALLGKGNAFEILAAVVGFALAIYFGSVMTTWKPAPMLAGPDAVDAEGWRVWSQDAVQKALADGKPVFVDFTAAWCLSCKVNERVALNVDSVRQAFKDKNVVLFKADWTHSDPEISKALRQYNRDGVPLYLLYSPKDPAKPQVLPEVLTPGIVMDALNRL